MQAYIAGYARLSLLGPYAIALRRSGAEVEPRQGNEAPYASSADNRAKSSTIMSG